MSYITYVLALKDSKIYVGCTNDLENRLRQHRNGHKLSALWVLKYPYVDVLETVNGGLQMEKLKTLEYMRKYGWENVRGYVWASVKMQYPPRALYDDTIETLHRELIVAKAVTRIPSDIVSYNKSRESHVLYQPFYAELYVDEIPCIVQKGCTITTYV